MSQSHMGISRVGRTLALVPIVFIALLFVLVAQSARAQSTIFNIPSTDVVGKGMGYFEFDFTPHAGVSVGNVFTQAAAGVEANGSESQLGVEVQHCAGQLVSPESGEGFRARVVLGTSLREHGTQRHQGVDIGNMWR